MRGQAAVVRSAIVLQLVVWVGLLTVVNTASAAAPQMRTQAPGFYRMMLGDFEVTALLDGTPPFPDVAVLTKSRPDAGTSRPKLFNNDRAEANALLAASDLSVPTEGSINAFLVNTGSKLVLIAASVVLGEKQASAVGTMFMRLTVANIGGVPAAPWIGQRIGWRMAFAGTAGLGLVAIAALWLALPRGETGTMPNVRRELRVFTRPAVLLAMAATVMGADAMFTLYTYVASTLAKLTGASEGFVTLALVLIVVGFTIGNGLGGRLADWLFDGATKIFLAALALIMLALPLLLISHVSAAIVLVVWGTAAFAIVSPVQMRVMEAASEAPRLASSINVGAFNLGNALGAAVSGAVISLGLGYAAVPVAGGLLAAAGLGPVWLGRARPKVQACEA